MAVVTVCADDFGLTPGICEGILSCLERKRISATSCMTAGAAWKSCAGTLRPFSATADIGLHFTLTDHDAAGAAPILAPRGRLPSLSRVAQLALTRRLPRREVEQQLARQLDAFEEYMGVPPAHVDGHHHVHQFPGVRDVVVATLRERYPSAPPYIRVSGDTVWSVFQRGIAIPKCLAIGAFSAAMRTLAVTAGFVTNEGFSGICSEKHMGTRAGDAFERFLRAPGPRMLIMCHPGRSDQQLAGIDSWTSQRDAEAAFLLGSEWHELLQKHGLQLGRLVRR